VVTLKLGDFIGRGRLARRRASLTLLLVVLLVVLWGAVIVPTLLRHRQSPRSSSDKFREHLAALNARSQVRASTRRPAGSAGRWIMGPPVSHSVERPRRTGPSTGSPRPSYGAARNPVDQRRSIFFCLLGGSASSLILGLVPHLGFLLDVNVVLDIGLAGYIVYLVRTKRRQDLGDLISYAEPRPEEEHWLAAGEM
jgi:hypothetical protein